MLPKKPYTYSSTTPVVADIIAKVRSMESLTAQEELVYLVEVKNISKEAAEKIVENNQKVRKK